MSRSIAISNLSLRTMLLNWLFLPSLWRSRHEYTLEADFICPQAFGRNTYSDKEVGPIIDTMLSAIDSHIARFEWLKSQGFDPGHPNKILALRCIRFAKVDLPIFDKNGIVEDHLIVVRPVIGQWEVLYAMWCFEPDWYAKHQDLFTPIWPPIKGYLATHGMFQAVRWITENHALRTPLIVAHPEHIQRCFFIARKVFGKPVAVDTGHSMMDHDYEWFDRASVQRWTRGPKVWFFYEMLTRIHHRLHGWM